MRPAPIFVLAGPFANGPLIGAMIGCNPAACAVAELNLFVADTLESAWLDMARHGPDAVHGLLRTVAQFVAGEQTIASVAMARRWVMRRMHWPTRRVFDELRSRAAPFRIVDKSRAHLRSAEHLKRIAEACPDAFYVYVAADPPAGDAAVEPEVATNPAFLRAGSTPADLRWTGWEIEDRITAFLTTVPSEQTVLLKGAALMAEPEAQLSALCAALGLPADPAAVSAMLRPEVSPFARFGPAGANLGDDPEFLRNPQFRPDRAGTRENASSPERRLEEAVAADRQG